VEARSSSAEANPNNRRGRNALQEEQRRRTRSILIEAAIAIFGERGYLETSIEHVLVRAGVSRAAFYTHFDGKLDLVCAIAEDFQPTWRPVFEKLAGLEAPTLDALAAWSKQHMALHRDHSIVCGLLAQVATLEETLHRQLAGQRDALIRRLGTRYPAFARAAQDPDALLRARVLLGHIDQICFSITHHRLPDPEHGAAQLIAEALDHFLNGRDSRRG